MIQEGMGLLHSSGPFFGTFFYHVTSNCAKKIQFCTLIYHLLYEFFQSLFEMPGINDLIDFLSLAHKCSQHLIG
jgi:hypothetical protein